mgnify:CR=1 FL=1
MSTELTYNQFRSAHKGTTRPELSNLWTQYKAGEYIFPVEESPEPEHEEEVTEVIDSPEEVLEEVVEEVIEEVEEVEKELTPLEACKEFDRLRTSMEKFSFRFPPATLKLGREKMAELAKQTIPKGYVCSPTDSWKIWFGPTSMCLLINTTHMMGFKVTRQWWQKYYQTAVYVDRELLQSNDIIDIESKKLAVSGKYVPRTPLVGVECKLPRDVKDIQMRGGQAGDF